MEKNNRKTEYAKRSVCLVLSCFLLLSCFSFVGTRDVVAANPKVAKVYIITYKQGDSGSSTPKTFSIFGHTFFAVLNTSKTKIKVGKYKLSPNAFLTLGTWGNIPDGKKIYYNVEKYRMINTSTKYLPNVYLSKKVTKSQLNKLSSTINDNNQWSVMKNCARFARYCWNSMVGKKSKLRIKAASIIETPAAIYKKIKKKRFHKSDFAFGEKRFCKMRHVFVQKRGKLKSLSKKAKKKVREG